MLQNNVQNLSQEHRVFLHAEPDARVLRGSYVKQIPRMHSNIAC